MWLGRLILAFLIATPVIADELHLSQRPHALMNSLMHSDTTTSSPLDDRLILGNGTAWEVKAVPNCGEAGTLNYDAAANAFSCLTDASGGGGAGNFVEASVDYGSNPEGPVATVTVPAAWVAADSKIVCTPLAVTTDGQSLDSYFIAGLQPTVSNRVVATSFDLTVFNSTYSAGIFRFSCTGGS